MIRVAVFDTHYVTDNLGDQIIMSSVMRHLETMFPEGFFTGVPTHDYIGPIARKALRESAHAFVGGTNILSSHLGWYRQWKMRLTDLRGAKKPILMGVGWHKYESDADFLSRQIYARMLSKEFKHSVRDAYTFNKMKLLGFENVINTGCPTMWSLDAAHQAKIPTEKKDSVVFTLTAYLRNIEFDTKFVSLLQERYENVYFWPQMYGDLAYLNELPVKPVTQVSPSTGALKALFETNTVDYVGMRLHCGILALQCGVRSLIVSVDNRAAEISKDTNLPTVSRSDLGVIDSWIAGSEPLQLTVPFDKINEWKAQFA